MWAPGAPADLLRGSRKGLGLVSLLTVMTAAPFGSLCHGSQQPNGAVYSLEAEPRLALASSGPSGWLLARGDLSWGLPGRGRDVVAVGCSGSLGKTISGTVLCPVLPVVTLELSGTQPGPWYWPVRGEELGVWAPSAQGGAGLLALAGGPGLLNIIDADVHPFPSAYPASYRGGDRLERAVPCPCHPVCEGASPAVSGDISYGEGCAGLGGERSRGQGAGCAPGLGEASMCAGSRGPLEPPLKMKRWRLGATPQPASPWQSPSACLLFPLGGVGTGG